MSLFRLRQKVRDEARSSEQRRRRKDLGRACRLGLEALEMRLAPAGISTWNGSVDDKWSTPANWDSLPVDGNDLVFPAGQQNTTNVNDLVGVSNFATLTLSDVNYHISGAAISLSGKLSATNGVGTDEISLPITFSTAGTVDVTQATTTLVLDGLISGTNGITKTGDGTLQLTQDNDYTGTTAVSGGILEVDGTQEGSAIALASGTTLRGRGRVGGITTTAATVSPGDAAGTAVLTDTGELTLDGDSTYSVALNGTIAGDDYTQLAVSGQVTLNGATLSTTLGFSPTGNEQFMIINNTGSSDVSGTFDGLAEGAEFTAGGQSFQITYEGGDGNDVVLTHLLDTTTTVSGTPTTSVFGQSVTLTATVSPVGAGTPTGNVQFFSGSTSLGTAPLSGGTASLPTTALPVGIDPITAKYLGDEQFAMSTSIESDVTVTQASTTTTVSPAPNPSVFGQGVALTATVAPVAPGAGTPTGMVQFFSGGSPLGSALLNAGVATFTTTALAKGTDSITAVYQGDANFTLSTSPGVDQTVNQASTTTTFLATPNPASLGSPVTLTATVAPVSPGSGTPTGTVQFFNGSTSLGTGTLSGGVAVLQTSDIPLGANAVTAQYSGDTNFVASTSPPVTVTVNQATTTTVTVDKSTIKFGDSIKITATVTPNSGSGTPTGNVAFFAGTTNIGNAALGADGKATLDTTTLPGGTDAITAQYNGQNPFGGSTSSAVNVTVNKADTTSTVTATPNPANLNQLVTLTLTVTSASTSPVKPSGTVTFLNGGVSLGTAVLNPSGIATLTTAALSLGANAITAQFPGDTNYNASTSPPVTVTVKQGTNTALSSNLTKSVAGQPVTLTANVTATGSGQGVPTGSVQFLNGNTVLDTVQLVNGVATLTTTALPIGAALLTAKYQGDGTFNVSTSNSTTVTVSQADTTTTVAVKPNPSNFSQVVTLTATVKPVSPGTGVPTGAVQFNNGTTSLGVANLVNGVATLTTTALALGSNSVTAAYQGDTNFDTSTSAPVTATVRSSAAAVTLKASKTTTVAFEAITLTATVTAGAGGTGSPTGTVMFFANNKLLGSSTIASGVATLATSKLAVGTDTIFAVYQGDANFKSARSNTVKVTSGDQTEQYLNAVYVDALGRTATLAELDLWRTQLRIGVTRHTVVSRIVSSPEGQIAQVRAVYRQFLRRLPTNAEIIQGTTALKKTTGFRYEASILGTKEYFNKEGGGTNSGFVTALFRDVLGTVAPPATQAQLVRALNRGTSRTSVALGLIQSAQGKTALVNFLIRQTFGRPATQGELQYYVPQLRGGRIQPVFINILSSDDFFEHFRATA